jgi:hypothetical protein
LIRTGFFGSRMHSSRMILVLAAVPSNSRSR